ncbi:VirB8/TrbF family protein [Pseudomonadota bacterium]
MAKKEDTNNIDNALEEEYKEILKESISSGSYFKDALDWFSIKYINPVTEKTLLTIVFFLSIVVTYIIITMISGLLPLKQNIPIILKERDASKYLPIIKKLKDRDTKTTDEAIAKYLIINYLKNREEHYYPEGDLVKYNQKFDIIKNNSTEDVFIEFKKFMSKTSSDSPIHYFGKNIKREIKLVNFTFIREKKKFWNQAKDLLRKEIIPKNVEIDYTVVTIVGSQVVKNSQLAKVSFDFNGIETNSEDKYLPLKFKITSYKNYNN